MTTSSSKNKKTHIRDIILLVSIPLGLLILAAAYVYVPRLAANPEQDFIFAKCSDSYCSDSYKVVDGTITLVAPKYGPLTTDSPMDLYRYDVSTDSTKLLSLRQANSYRLDTASRSSDGYTLEYQNGSSGGFLLFYDSTEGGWYLQNGALKKPVTLPSSSYTDNREIQFLGWIE